MKIRTFGYVVILAMMTFLPNPHKVFAEDTCDGFEFAECGFIGCYYYGTSVVTAGPTDCRVSRQKSTAAASCPSDPSEDKCLLSVSSTTVTKYSLTGSITWQKWGGLTADYATQTTNVYECKGPWPIAVGGLDCKSEPYPPSQSCCKESWDRRRTTSKEVDVYCLWTGAGGDFGECNGPQTDGDYMCSEYGTLVEIKENNCGDCAELQECS